MPLLDRIFNPISLILLNLAIIIIVEFTNGGKYFFETGLIHIVAILFIALIVARIFYHHYTYDPIFEKFVHGTLIASLVFASSHIFEYASMHIYGIYNDSVFANVVNFYLIGFIIIAIGAELFLKVIARRSAYLAILLFAVIVSLAALSALFIYNPKLISLEMDHPAPYLYTILVTACAFIGISIIMRIKTLVPISTAFINYSLASIILILASTVPYIFYEFIEENLHYIIEGHQIIYISHFIFFAALSLLFLAFTKLKWGGLYAETRNFTEKQ